MKDSQIDRTFRKPIPEGVVEHVGLGPNAIVTLNDGALMLITGDACRTSTDGGQTWGEPRPLNCETMGSAQGMSCIRLQSGKLALAHRGKEIEGQGTEMFNWNPFYLSVSEDEGGTWAGAWPMNLLGGPYDKDAMVQLSSGRLLMPSRICHSNNGHPGLEYERASTYGYWKGLRVQLSGHYHYPEIDIASVSRSDDEGRTWRQCDGQLMGWFDADGIPNGRGGITAVDEPNVAECADGRAMLMARSTVGRLVQSYSEDGGETWSAVLPSDLSSSYSPPKLRRIPSTGDLLCVWNQVSRDETRRGHRRGRLSAAISKDSGSSWEHFRTIEVSEGIEDVDRIPPQYPIAPIVGMPEVGALPDGWLFVHYANVHVIGEKVFLSYLRGTPELGNAEQVLKRQESVLRIYPLEWFYG